ncbi:heparinase II/III family protein [Methanogenium cariaci]|uniref:heparinase II/III family protein n=1 Tax=Methanogenium cariaci TaxID=2197 RepID=UPI0007807B48|nr:heparinase II/III family protein [Methanogenium cariaci]
MNNYVTSGNTLETYQRGGIISLLNDQEKGGEVLRYLDQTKGDSLLPYSRENDLAPTKLLYTVYGNYNGVSRESPEWTSHLDEDAIYQVFRGGDWEEDSDWLSLVTFDVESNSNRDSAHHDQLSIEYYSRGDLLLADAGETKHILDTYYGQYAAHHNSIQIEDPQTPFATSFWADSQARGVYKGDATGLDTPVTVDTTIQTPWMDSIVASEKITDVIGSSWSDSDSLSSPIDYSRTIMYPEDDYFVIFDRFDGTEEWTYRNVFRPTSLSIAPTSQARLVMSRETSGLTEPHTTGYHSPPIRAKPRPALPQTLSHGTRQIHMVTRLV